MLLVISSVSLLHVNQYEFIFLRFPGLTLLKVSYFNTVLYVSYLTIGIVVGLCAQMLGKRKIFILFGSAGSILFFGLMTRASSYPILLTYRFFQGSFTVMEWQILMTLVLDNSTAYNRGKSLGVFGLFLAVSMGIGPVLGGIISQRGVFLPYYVAIAENCIVFVFTLFFIKDPTTVEGQPSFGESLGILKFRPGLLIPGIFNFVDRLHIGFIIFILPLYIEFNLGYGPSAA